MKILVLDDAKVIRSLLKLTLESDGIEVDISSTVDEAMRYASQIKYDLMIIDYMLEDQHTGLELIEQIKTSGPNQDTISIILSAEDGVGCKQKAQQLGVHSWMKKPFTPTGILKSIYQVLGKDNSAD